MHLFQFVLVAIFSSLTQSAHAENNFLYTQIKPALQVIKCTATLKSLPVRDTAESLTVILYDVHYVSTCEDGTSQVLNLFSTHAAADAICRKAGFKSGSVNDIYFQDPRAQPHRDIESYEARLNAQQKLELVYHKVSDEIITSIECTK